MGTQDNVSQLVEGCYTWETLVNTELSVYPKEFVHRQNIF